LPTLTNNFAYFNQYSGKDIFIYVLQSKIEYNHNVVSEP
jgi:hypothetical protein